MIFGGDVAVPGSAEAADLKGFFDDNQSIFRDQTLVVNLEGLISDADLSRRPTPILFNHPSVLKVLADAGVKAACLANNHTLDLPDQFAITQTNLSLHGIQSLGAGFSLESANANVTLEEQGARVIILNSCWDFLLYHQKNPSGKLHVNILRERELLAEVRRLKSGQRGSSVVVFLHWSFDLETLPFPMYRKFSRELIDAGASVVVGCHSHCLQGGEKYNDGYIVYGLGNFFLPAGVFANGRLQFPTWTQKEMLLQWDPATGHAICHWIQYSRTDTGHRLEYVKSEPFESSEELKKCSPYQDMSDKEYKTYFRRSRRKKILIPVFDNHEHVVENRAKVMWLKFRALAARRFAKWNFINWQH